VRRGAVGGRIGAVLGSGEVRGPTGAGEDGGGAEGGREVDTRG
jgi:hypothetical protein